MSYGLDNNNFVIVINSVFVTRATRVHAVYRTRRTRTYANERSLNFVEKCVRKQVFSHLVCGAFDS